MLIRLNVRQGQINESIPLQWPPMVMKDAFDLHPDEYPFACVNGQQVPRVSQDICGPDRYPIPGVEDGLQEFGYGRLGKVGSMDKIHRQLQG